MRKTLRIISGPMKVRSLAVQRMRCLAENELLDEESRAYIELIAEGIELLRRRKVKGSGECMDGVSPSEQMRRLATGVGNQVNKMLLRQIAHLMDQTLTRLE